MEVLITGGAGFIGSHLCDYLIGKEHSVVIVDDFSTGSRRNLRHFGQEAAVEVIEGDVRDPQTFASLPKPDLVYHLAAGVGVRTILDKPLHSLETNLRGTENVLVAAVDWGSPVIVASTSEVYGKNDGPLSEDSDRLLGAGEVARWWYAVAKMADEALALAYHREDRVQTLVVRFFNTVGPRQTGRYGMVVPTLVRQALGHEPLTVYGDGEQTRCFTYIEDAVRALAALAERPDAYGRIYNIGQPSEISINDLAKRILARTDSRSKICHIPYAEAYGDSYEDMRRRVPDCARLRETIGWTPTDRLDEAIQVIADEFRRDG